MLTLTSEYALRALIYMAGRFEHQPLLGKEIAQKTGIPPKYLLKVLGDLVRVGVLESTRGRGGGFRMVRPPGKIRLYEVLAPFEPFERRRCPFGNIECSDDDPCMAHDRWKKVIEAEQRFLKGTSLRNVALKKREPRSRKAKARSRKGRPRRR